MDDKLLFVDNPLELSGLYGDGIFLIAEREKGRFEYSGAGTQGILNIFYFEQRGIPAKILDVLTKLMTAVKPGGKNLIPSDFASINAAEVLSEDRIAEIVEDFQPSAIIIWNDEWFSPQPQIPFYTKGLCSGIKTLRCHSLQTVMSDEERKRECWMSIKRFFSF